MEAKPFSCPLSECKMTFANEDHLTVHKKKHELSLTLTPTPGFKNLLDQTPTPTRFLNALDTELFQDFHNDNPFDATFRKANSSNGAGHNFVIPDSSSLIASLPDSEVLNTPSITLPNDSETPVSLKPPDVSNRIKEADSSTCTENTDSLPFTPNSESTSQGFDPKTGVSSSLPEEDVNLAPVTTNLSVLTEAVQREFQKKRAPRTNVVQTPVITSIGTAVLKGNAVGVPTAVVVTRPLANNTTPPISNGETVVGKQPSHEKVPEPAQPVVQSVCVTPMIQLMIRLPDGQTMPVQFPVMTSSTPASQPSQTSNTQSTANSVTKMKLKEVLTMNQKSGNKTRSKPAPLLPDTLENLGLSLSPPPQRQGHTGRKRKDLSDDPDEKRRRSLERNRAAATRCREKRKRWITALERKADELYNTNTQLQHEVSQLRDEVAHLKTLLLAHKDCPVTLQQKASVEKDTFTTVRIVTSSREDVQCVPSSEVMSPLNASQFMEIEINSVQSISDSSLTSDTSEASCRDR